MKVQEKVQKAREVLSSIIDHDDAPLKDIEQAIGEINTFAKEQLQAARIRRKAQVHQKEEE